MREQFVPKHFQVPQQIYLGEYTLHPITTKDAVEDWQVLTKNAETIAQIRGEGSRSEWPFVCTLEQNYKDVAWLEICATYRQLFSYILRTKKDSSYAGCIYIYPIELFFPEKAIDYDIDFSFWITKSEFDNGNYEKIFELLLEWLIKDWQFRKDKIFLRNQLIPNKFKIRQK